jgi:tetratricopeptide (TPR) repeat protein
VRRAILHIGTEKTGTTTLQAFLAANRDRLAARGYQYPSFCGALNHTGLAAYALDDAADDPIRAPYGYGGAAEISAFRDRIEQAARSDLADGHDAIFCSEHCHSRLQTPEEIARLYGFLSQFFDDIRVCIYLRRQDRVALSLYTTLLKSGNAPTGLLPEVHTDDPYFNYDRSLSLWESVFGRENIRVGLFDRKELVGGSVVSDFLACWRLGAAGDFGSVPDQNGSLDPAAQVFLHHVNPHLTAPEGMAPDRVRGSLVALLERLHAGRGSRPSRSDAGAFYARFADSNERVRRRYFPERERLFDDVFDDYPEEADRLPETAAALSLVAARLHKAMHGEICRLEAEIRIRDARLAWERDDRCAAIDTIRQALAWRPDHVDGWRTLGEYMLRDGRADEAVEAAETAAALRPGCAEFWHFLGMAQLGAGKLSEALRAQERALALEPGHRGAAIQRDQLVDRLSTASTKQGLETGRAAG